MKVYNRKAYIIRIASDNFPNAPLTVNKLKANGFNFMAGKYEWSYKSAEYVFKMGHFAYIEEFSIGKRDYKGGINVYYTTGTEMLYYL